MQSLEYVSYHHSLGMLLCITTYPRNDVFVRLEPRLDNNIPLLSSLGSNNQCFKLVLLLVVRILGAMSIIISAVVRRRVFNSEVHPIFMISLADCMLGVLWIVGAVLWFIPHETFNLVWCYALTLLTAVSSLLPYVLM